MNTIQGEVTHLLPTQSGVSSSGREWTKGGFVIETSEKHPKTICFTTWSITVMNEARIGNIVKVDFEVESREYNGRYYTDATAKKVEAVGKAKVDKRKEQMPNMMKRAGEMEWPDTSGLKVQEEKPTVDVSDLPF